MPFRYLEGLTTADVAFEATGKNINELFESAGMALFDIMADPKSVGKAVKKGFSLGKNNLEDLMYAFLDEIIFLKDSEGMVFSSCKVVVGRNEDLKLKAVLYGDKVKHEEQELRVDAKAVTMHKFRVEKGKSRYKATVIIDI